MAIGRLNCGVFNPIVSPNITALAMSRSHNNSDFILTMLRSSFNARPVIPLVEDVINAEKMGIEATSILCDDVGRLKKEYAIANAQILLSILRMHCGDSGSGS
jgi:hypothetical protein